MAIEWSVPDQSVQVRQGDFLICRDPNTGRVEEICLVITADCDISKGKFGRQLACLRVIPFHDYLRKNWAGRKLEKIVKDEKEKLRGQIAKWHTQLIGKQSELTADAAITWVRRDDPVSICNELNVPQPERRKFSDSLASFRAAWDAMDEKDPADSMSQYVSFRAISLGREVDVCRQDVLKDAQKEKLPEDVFLLPSLPHSDKVEAAVVLLREIVAVPHKLICYRASDAISDEMFLRVGRLEPTYKYAVSQAFGTLYSRIGLPDDYERRCKNTIEQINDFPWG